MTPEPGGFFAGTLLPLAEDDSAWLAAGDEIGYPKADARQVARLAIDLATREPDLVFRNQEKASQGWVYMRRDREEFVAFFGGDELVLPTLEAEGRLNAYYKMRRDSALAARGRHRAVSDTGETTFVMPDGFFEFDTVGIIYDELDGFVVVPEYGMLRALFADPALAADPLHANVLRAYLREDTIPPLPLRRMAAAFPGNVDAVFRRVLGNRTFTWQPERDRPAQEAQARLLRGGAAPREWRCSATASWPWPAAPASRRPAAAGRREVRVKLHERVEHAEVGERGQGPLGRLAVQAGPGDRVVEQAVHQGGVRGAGQARSLGGAGGRLDLDVAQRQALDEQPAGQGHVVERVGRVARTQPDHRRELDEDGDHHLP